MTSREALRVRGEQLSRCRRSRSPPATAQSRRRTRSGSEAVQLFVERAIALPARLRAHRRERRRRRRDLPPARRAAARDRARRRAASRCSRPTSCAIALDGRLDVLAGRRARPARSGSGRCASTIEWSTELLTEAQRRVFQMFSVFVGARLSDVEGTARRLADNIDVLEGIGTLVDDSLVRNIPDEQGHPRLAMLETIRSYAAEQLDAEPDFADAVRRAHAEHYTELALALREQLARTDREQVLAALEVELGNLRAARGRTWLGRATSSGSTTCSNRCGATTTRAAPTARRWSWATTC